MQKTWVRVVTTLMTLMVMGMIFYFSTETAENSDASSGLISQWVADHLWPEWRELPGEERDSFYNRLQFVVRKCAHFTEFALLGMSLRLCLESWLGRRRGLFRGTWMGGTLYAAMDEIRQLFVDGRSGQWRDVMIDSAGVLTGLLLIMGFLYCIEKYRARSDGMRTAAGEAD